jgi:DegV family protein with EDD domain
MLAMAVNIVTDSLGDIPHGVAEELGVTVIPVYIGFGTETYRNGVDITTEQFYERLARSKTPPSTMVPSLGDFVTVYDRLAEQTDEILVITLSSKFSALHEVAQQAVKLMKQKCRVEVIDSLAGIMGEGMIVLATAKAARAGASFDELVKITRHNIPRTHVRMAFDTLEYLKRGGRIGKAQALLGSVLRLNPILGIRDGEAAPFARKRSRDKAIDYLYHFATGFAHIEEMAVEDATTPDEADMLADRLGTIFPRERIYRSKVSPVVGVHVGPHVLAVSVLGDKERLS